MPAIVAINWRKYLNIGNISAEKYSLLILRKHTSNQYNTYVGHVTSNN